MKSFQDATFDEPLVWGHSLRVTISDRNAIVLSNNDVILRSEGGRGSKKVLELRSSVKNPPYAQMHFLIRRGYETEILSTSGKYHKFQTAE